MEEKQKAPLGAFILESIRVKDFVIIRVEDAN
jgi:hypothetical protein